jgi:hypothetical protein
MTFNTLGRKDARGPGRGIPVILNDVAGSSKPLTAIGFMPLNNPVSALCWHNRSDVIHTELICGGPGGLFAEIAPGRAGREN